jgi:heme o synthase
LSTPLDTAVDTNRPPPIVAGADWRDYFALLKPRVMTLVVFTGIVGLLAAPGDLHPVLALTAILCLAVGAGAAGALNMWYEADIDALMNRTKARPIPAGKIEKDDAFAFAMTLSVGSVALMGLAVNPVAAGVLAISILFYVMVYTVWLKRRTPQNIVIGGAAGAFPPIIGWAAVTGDIGLLPVILFGIVFLWTPPHFWALALVVNMPVVAGEASTRRQIWWYSVVLAAASVSPWALGLLGPVYGVGAAVLSALFLAGAWAVWRGTGPREPKLLFGYSILYLFVLFTLVLADGWAAGGLL